MKPLTILLAILVGSLLLFTGCDSDKSGKSSGDSDIFGGTANAAVPSGGGVCATAIAPTSISYTLKCWSSNEWACLQAAADDIYQANKYDPDGNGGSFNFFALPHWFNGITCDQLCDQAKSDPSIHASLIECGD